jgi:hypothetical protein
MTPQVIADLEEALKREIALIYTHHQATKSNTTIETTFDVFTGEANPTSIEASFYDEAGRFTSVTYPYFSIKFNRIEEDRTSGRMISIWEDYNGSHRYLIEPNQDRPKVYTQVTSGREGMTDSSGITIDPIKFTRLEQHYLVKILNGNSKGTFKIKQLDGINKKIILDETLVENIQHLSFNESTRKLYLLDPTDLFTVQYGDTFVDASDNQFKIIQVNTKKRELLLGGSGTPDLEVGSKIVRNNGVLKGAGQPDVFYIIMDPTKPLFSKQQPSKHLTDQYLTELPPTPFNYVFTIEISNKERLAHRDIAERMTETFINRPRRAIKILLRCPDSFESNITCGSKNGSGFTIKVGDASCFHVNDSVYMINRFNISENNQIIDIDYENNLVTFRNRVPTEFDSTNAGKLVSNALVKYWSLFLEGGQANMSQDDVNSFYRQTYGIRIEGWKFEKTGQKVEGAVTEIQGTIETPSQVNEDFKV